MEPLRRAVPPVAMLALALAACRTVAPDEPAALPAHVMRERIADVEIGHTLAQVRDAVGTVPVLRPGRPESPFPTPLRTAEWRSPRGHRIRVETYVVAAVPAEGCPDVQVDDAPLAFVDGRLAAKAWSDLERHWRDWGGDLARLRALQERLACHPPDALPPEPRSRRPHHASAQSAATRKATTVRLAASSSNAWGDGSQWRWTAQKTSVSSTSRAATEPSEKRRRRPRRARSSR